MESFRDPAARRLRRGLRELDVDRKTTSEAFAVTSSGGQDAWVRLHRVPGATAVDLLRVFSTTVLGSKRSPWTPERVAGLEVLASRDRIEGVEYFGVMIAEPGLVAILGGHPSSVEWMLNELVAARAR
jgi:hypothetical protein